MNDIIVVKENQVLFEILAGLDSTEQSQLLGHLFAAAITPGASGDLLKQLNKIACYLDVPILLQHEGCVDTMCNIGKWCDAETIDWIINLIQDDASPGVVLQPNTNFKRNSAIHVILKGIASYEGFQKLKKFFKEPNHPLMLAFLKLGEELLTQPPYRRYFYQLLVEEPEFAYELWQLVGCDKKKILTDYIIFGFARNNKKAKKGLPGLLKTFKVNFLDLPIAKSLTEIEWYNIGYRSSPEKIRQVYVAAKCFLTQEQFTHFYLQKGGLWKEIATHHFKETARIEKIRQRAKERKKGA